MSDFQEKPKDVIVIGAGLGGLSSALLLQKHGLDIVVLEAQDHVGGRTLTKVDPQFGSIDIGAANIPPNHQPLIDLIHEMGVPLYMEKAKWDKIWYLNDEIKLFRDFYPRFWNPLINLDFNNTIRKLNYLMRQVSVSNPWDAPKASYFDSISVKDWAQTHIWTREVYGFILYACRMNLSVFDPAQVSMLYFLWFHKQFPGLICFFPSQDPTSEKPELKVRSGTQQISMNAAAKLGVESVHKNSPVTSIDQKEDHVIVTTKNGKQYIGKYVVVAIPISVYHQVSFMPAIPANRMAVFNAMQPSTCMKSWIGYDQRLWTDSDNNKSLICGDESCPIVSSSFHIDGNKVKVACICNGEVNGFGNKTPKERQDMLCQMFHKAFGSEAALHPVQYEEEVWMRDSYIQGLVVGILPPGILTKYKFEFKKPFGRVYFAGSEMAHKWVGQMAGGVISGQRAANEILKNLGKISAADLKEEEESQSKEEDVLPPYFHNPIVRNLAPSVGGALTLTFLGTGLALAFTIVLYKGIEEELNLI